MSAATAAAIDKELMSAKGGFSLDQLVSILLKLLEIFWNGVKSNMFTIQMELAGLSVAQAVHKTNPGRKILILAGPGNNGKL